MLSGEFAAVAMSPEGLLDAHSPSAPAEPTKTEPLRCRAPVDGQSSCSSRLNSDRQRQVLDSRLELSRRSDPGRPKGMGRKLLGRRKRLCLVSSGNQRLFRLHPAHELGGRGPSGRWARNGPPRASTLAPRCAMLFV